MNPRMILPAVGLAAVVSSGLAFAGGERCAQIAREQEAAKAKADAEAKAKANPVTAIDLCICLDTSGSMNGLIDSARARIWDIVSDLATAKPSPKLRVALVTFGNDGHSAENGWTNVDVNLSDDLDTVSQKLFALTTNGGTELVARVVDRATKQLDWTKDANTLKIMVVAGNESADQDGDIKYQDACKRAIESGILVNSIYCGADNDDLVAAWREVARLADGRSACINQNTGVVAMDTPMDAELLALNTSLNSTYLPYGAMGEWGSSNQQEQDNNATRLASSVSVQRCVSKGCSAYDNARWDLVDAMKKPDFKLEAVDAKDLPESMRNLKPEERKPFVEAKAKERAEINAKIQALGAKRQAYIAAETAKLPAGEGSFERAIREAVRAQAVARGLTFPAIANTPPAAIAAPQKPESPAKVAKTDGC